MRLSFEQIFAPIVQIPKRKKSVPREKKECGVFTVRQNLRPETRRVSEETPQLPAYSKLFHHPTPSIAVRQKTVRFPANPPPNNRFVEFLFTLIITCQNIPHP